MQIRISAQTLNDTPCDALAIGIPSEGMDEAVAALEHLFGDHLSATLASDDFKGKASQLVSYPTFGRTKAPRIFLMGVGTGDTAGLQQAAGLAGHAARNIGAKVVGLSLGDLDNQQTQRVAEAFHAGNYRFDKYKPETDRKAPVRELMLIGEADATAFGAAAAISAGRDLARDLVNEPAAEIYPESLAQVAQSLAGGGLSVEVWDEHRILEAGMGGIAGVGQGSDKAPRFIHMHYKPAGTPRRKVALVGKGVTFDSGGYSLKPSAGMQTMRCDMAGSAAVIGAMRAIRDIAPDVEVHGIVGAAENLINGNAYKLGDVLTMYNGKTVEVHNTDAEGRLVLADCLAYASKLDVDCIIDLATLTGACVVALGDHYVGLFTDSDDMASGILSSADEAGEAIWRLPLPAHYKEQLKAQWASIKNVGGRAGGSITAALFLKEFVDGPDWAHLDIAGPAFLDKGWRQWAPGGTGTMVATLCQWVSR
jgi:leucyl aminopeptidase